MSKAVFEDRFGELIQEIQSMPEPRQKKLIMLAKRVRRSHARLRKGVDDMRASLDYLRISVKYLLFDLEATRRENARLVKIIQDRDQ